MSNDQRAVDVAQGAINNEPYAFNNERYNAHQPSLQYWGNWPRIARDAQLAASATLHDARRVMNTRR
eukprot:7717280-Lingulodinium_polyedra.AAC.1